MTIRMADPRDIPGMIALLLQVGEVHHRIRPDLFRSGAQKYDEAALLSLLSDPTRPIFIAGEEGTVDGYCFCILQETKNDPVLCDRKVLYIDDLCVDEQIRGKGIGTALYNAVCDYARKLPCDSITLNVWCCNKSAMKFYEHLGLVPQKIGMEKML